MKQVYCNTIIAKIKLNNETNLLQYCSGKNWNKQWNKFKDVYKAIMISITLYAMESLALQDKHQSSIKAVEYKCMRRIIDETRRVRVCNDRIIDEAG